MFSKQNISSENLTGSEFPVDSINPNPTLVEQNVYRRHDRTRGVLLKQKTLDSQLNGWTWNLILLLFIPFRVVTEMFSYIAMRGSDFWQGVKNVYENFDIQSVVGFYHGYDEHTNSTVYGLVSGRGGSWQLDILSTDSVETSTRIDLGHWRVDFEKQQTEKVRGKKFFLVMQNLGRPETFIQFAHHVGTSFVVDSRPERTRFPARPYLPSFTLQKCSKNQTLILLLSYVFSVMVDDLSEYRASFNQNPPWKRIYGNIMKALNYSASLTSPILQIRDDILPPSLIAHCASEQDNITLARELALSESDASRRSTIGNSNKLAIHDMQIYQNMAYNQTSSE